MGRQTPKICGNISPPYGGFKEVVGMTDTVVISEKDLKEIVHHLCFCQDEGPIPEGWKSKELEELLERMESLLK